MSPGDRRLQRAVTSTSRSRRILHLAVATIALVAGSIVGLSGTGAPGKAGALAGTGGTSSLSYDTTPSVSALSDRIYSPFAAEAELAGAENAADGGGGLVYSVDSAGETTVSFTTSDGDTFDFSSHALQHLTQRGVPIDDVTSLLDDSSSSFRYFHDGAWKTGFYDPSSGLFVGTANGNVTTVIGNASQNYINNLMAAQP